MPREANEPGQGLTDQALAEERLRSAAAMVNRSSQQLGAAAVAVGQAAGKVEEIRARVRGLGGLGN